MTREDGTLLVSDFLDTPYRVLVEGEFGIGRVDVGSIEFVEDRTQRVEVPLLGRLVLSGRPSGEPAMLSLVTTSFHGPTGHGLSAWTGTLRGERVLALWPGYYELRVTEVDGVELLGQDLEVLPGGAVGIAVDD